MARRFDIVSYTVAAGVKGADQVELWRELCARLEAIVAEPRYAGILASGDGIPRCRDGSR